MATQDAELSGLSDREIDGLIARERKTFQELEALDSHEVFRNGTGAEVLVGMRAARSTITAAEAEVARRAEVKPQTASKWSGRRWEISQLERWALDPNPTEPRGGRDPDPLEATQKAFWLHRGGMPKPLVYENLDASRLSVEEGEELHVLSLRGRKGTLQADEVPRVMELLERACAVEAGAVERYERFEEERREKEHREAKARREADARAEVERERRLAAMPTPRTKGRR